MRKIDTGGYKSIYPVQFVSPLSIAECKNRLQVNIGKPMGDIFTPIEGELETIDETTCSFILYQSVNKGGKPTIKGYLYSTTNNATVIDAVFTRIPRPMSDFLPIPIMIIIFLLAIQQITLALILAITVAVGTIVWKNRPPNIHHPRVLQAEPISQLLWWFERTLKS